MDDDDFNCHVGNGRCVIECNNKVGTIAFRKKDLYLLSLRESVNYVCELNEIVSPPIVENRKRKRTHDISSKLWHCCLGHISRGRI